MAKVVFQKPRIITIEYQQEKTDPDYGTCLWARFTFDLANYELSISSDCGSYSYEWIATEKEPFLKLMLRVNKDYLLDKLSSRSVVNASETWNNFYKYVKELIDEAGGESKIYFGQEDWDDIKFACVDTNKFHVFNAIRDKLESIEPICEYVEHPFIWSCIETDYPDAAYTIVRIFDEYIKPALKIYLEKENG